MDSPVIELHDLTKRYGTFTAVDHLNLTINKGEVFGLLGPNGAGKSTTILMMLGLTEPSAGSVSICGINATINSIEVKRKVGYLPDDVDFYENYSGLENLLYTARLNRVGGDEVLTRARKLLERVDLSAEANKKAGKYSRGMRQRLGLADVLIKNPEIIILDEPTLGIDPKGVHEFLDLIVQLSREEGITVLLSSHHLHQVQQVCDRVGLFVDGRLLAEGDIPTLSAKLFPEEAFTVSVKVDFQGGDGERAERERFSSIIQAIDGVNDIQSEDGCYHIRCSHDVTAAIAKAIVGNDFNLIYLHQKQYGLDEIYHHYFEGKRRNGKAN